MRSRTSHAAKSGVGEHKARESESAQHCADGKECVASTHLGTSRLAAASFGLSDGGPLCALVRFLRELEWSSIFSSVPTHSILI